MEVEKHKVVIKTKNKSRLFYLGIDSSKLLHYFLFNIHGTLDDKQWEAFDIKEGQESMAGLRHYEVFVGKNKIMDVFDVP